ncbi:uncharacterized protein LOC111628123 [Centruroides sculpturatus]|uniref:uncharacterized protein LOC111628123 n=1 Tax=Centruroides sculpturatus TaxID=218467 RepID=UPI000C6E3773|nr:uncharacterized protein LOC111628123 [Centruroides sculpturatus]
MPRGVTLTENEIRKIYFFKGKGWPTRKIASKLGRSQTAVQNVLKKGDNYNKIKRTGRKPSLQPRDHRRITSLATNESLSTHEIAAVLSTPVSNQTVWKSLRKNKTINFMKLKSKPKLTELHRSTRLQWAKDHVNWTTEWRKIDF